MNVRKASRPGGSLCVGLTPVFPVLGIWNVVCVGAAGSEHVPEVRAATTDGGRREPHARRALSSTMRPGGCYPLLSWYTSYIHAPPHVYQLRACASRPRRCPQRHDRQEEERAFVPTPATMILARLVPDATLLHLDAWTIDATTARITLPVRSTQRSVPCPLRMTPAQRVHMCSGSFDYRIHHFRSHSLTVLLRRCSEGRPWDGGMWKAGTKFLRTADILPHACRSHIDVGTLKPAALDCPVICAGYLTGHRHSGIRMFTCTTDARGEPICKHHRTVPSCPVRPTRWISSRISCVSVVKRARL